MNEIITPHVKMVCDQHHTIRAVITQPNIAYVSFRVVPTKKKELLLFQTHLGSFV
jgi:hypothetical protein